MSKIQKVGLLAMSAMTLVVVLVMGQNKIDCDVPEAWSTRSGVEQCAVNGGK